MFLRHRNPDGADCRACGMSGHLEPDETELAELTRSVTKKLTAMSDEEYAGLSDTLIPDYEEQEG